MFAEKGIHFDLITYGGFFYEGMDILDEFPSQAGLRYAERIVLLTSQWNHIMSKSAVMFFPHISFYRKFSMQVKLASYYYNPLRFIIYCEEMVMNDLLMVAKPMYLNMSPGHIAMYQYFLIKSNNGIELVSFEWFTEKVCNYPMINSINIFDTNLMKWKQELEIPEKFRNFYGCMLTIGLTPGRLYMHIDNSGNPFGPPIDLFKAMATLGNFTFNHQILQRDMNGGFLPVPQNGIVMDIQVYFQIPRVAFSRITDFMHLTTVFLEEKVSFVLTDAEPYSSYEDHDPAI